VTCLAKLLQDIDIKSIEEFSKAVTLEKDKHYELTLSTSHTLTVLSIEDVARRGMLGLKRTSVTRKECSSRVAFWFRESVNHKTACIMKKNRIISVQI